jgi:hypothetical protein
MVFTEQPGNRFFKTFNYGILCNKETNLMAVDLDSHKWSPEQTALFEGVFGADYLDRFDTYTQRTPSGGWHLLFEWDEHLKQTQSKSESKFGEGIDIRSGYNNKGGGYVVGAGSSINGKVYKCTKNAPAKPIPPNLKEWLLDHIYSAAARKIRDFDKALEVRLNQSNSKCKYRIDDAELEAKVLNNLPASYLSEYGDWLKFTSAMKAMRRKGLWKKFSKRSVKYDKAKNAKCWSGAKADMVAEVFKAAKQEHFIPYIKYKPAPNNKRAPDRTLESRAKLSQMGAGDTTFLKLDPAKSYVIKSDTATGKTTLMKRTLAEGMKFCSIVSRVSLGAEQHREFNGTGLIDIHWYMSHHGKAKNDSFVSTIDSIHRYKYFDFSDHVVFFDEFNSMVEYLMDSSTLAKTREECWHMLKQVIKTCKSFVCADADISDLCFKLLDGVGRDYTYVANPYKHNAGVPVHEVDSLDAMIDMLEQETKFIVCCDSKSSADYIHAELGDGVKKLTSDKNTELKDGETLDDFDRIVMSPKVIYGLDSVMRRKVFAYHKEHTISPSSFVQQICRCRDIEALYFHFNKKQYTDPKYVTLAECKAHVEALEEFSSECEHGDASDPLFVDMLGDLRYKKDCQDTNKCAHFLDLIEHRGFKLQTEKRATECLTPPKQKEIKELVDNWELDNFDIESEQVRAVNGYIGLKGDDQIMSAQVLFTDCSALQQYFAISKYFYHYTVDLDLDSTYECVAEEGGGNFKSIVPRGQIVPFLRAEALHKKLGGMKEVTIKKLDTIEQQMIVMDQLRIAADIDIGENGTFTSRRVMSEKDQCETIQEFMSTFRFTGKKAVSLATTAANEMLLFKMLKQVMGDSLVKSTKKRVGGTRRQVYSIDYESDIWCLTKKVKWFQQKNEEKRKAEEKAKRQREQDEREKKLKEQEEWAATVKSIEEAEKIKLLAAGSGDIRDYLNQ